jgi:dTDP-4-dehydrorhamnose reductase
MARPPILVFGAEGQLARALARHHALDGHLIVCRGRGEGADIADAAAVEATLAELAPSAVVNTAAYTAVDKAETDSTAAFAVNTEGPRHLARACASRAIPLIHVSTDYVFDGAASTPYREEDPIAPLGVYGASKAAGEAAIRENCPWHIILRTAWLYSLDGRNFLTTMLGCKATENAETAPIRVVNDQCGCPTSTHDVASAILTLLYRIFSSPDDRAWGTYHLTSSGATTWFGFATEIFRLASAEGRAVPRVIPITTAERPTPARRPRYSVLDNSKIASTFDIRLPAWQDSLAFCMAQGMPQGMAQGMAQGAAQGSTPTPHAKKEEKVA